MADAPEEKKELTWEIALVDARELLTTAEKELAAAKSRVNRLRGAIRIIQERIAGGDPFPGSTAEQVAEGGLDG